MQKVSESQKLSILDAVRLIAALCIVVLHSFLEKNDFMNIYGAEIIGRWPVGLFFIISGFFLSFNSKDVFAYCFKILRVYIIWTVFYAVWLDLDIWSPMRFLSALRSGIIMPFWYFSSLLMCVVFVFFLFSITKDLRIVCFITGLMFIIALLGCSFRFVPAVADFMDRFFFPWHERLIGVRHMRNGVFNGSFYIALGALLRKKYDIDRLIVRNIRLLYVILGIAIILHIAEICTVIHFHTGEPDVLLTSPLLAALLVVFSFQFTMSRNRATLCRGMSNMVFLSHCFYIDVFQRIGFGQWVVFTLTICCSLLFSFCVVKMSVHFKFLRYLY